MPWWLVVLAIFITATLEREVILLLLMALVSAILGREILLFVKQRSVGQSLCRNLDERKEV
jgi:predicted CDP-diglyceride synthetase/phosphatidate cytidylyltransferase